MARILDRAYRAIEADPRRRSLAELRAELESSDRTRRVKALVRIRKQIDELGLRDGYFAIARRHLNDRDSTCRWQAAIVVGEFIPTRGDQVWAMARQLARSPIKDVRMAASTVLLEHLLEYHPARMIPKFEAELATGDQMFRRSVAMCANFNTGRLRRRVQTLIDQAKAV